VLTCLFGKPEAIEAIALGEHGKDERMGAVCVEWAALPEPLILQDEDELFRISRHRRGKEIWTWIGIYRPAFAIGSKRPGGFYGAAVLCLDEKVGGLAAIHYLRKSADELARSTMAHGSFLQKVAPLDPTLDFDGIKRELAPEPLANRSGLQADSDNEAFIHVPASLSEAMIGQLIDEAQGDGRFMRESAIYVSRSAQLAGIARTVEATTRIKGVYTATEYYGRPPTPPPEPPAPRPAPSLPLRNTHHAGATAAAAETQTMSRDDTRRLIDARVKEEVERALAEQLPKLLREQRPLSKRRHWYEAGAVTATMLLLFIIAVFLALPYAGQGSADDGAREASKTSPTPSPSPTEDPAAADVSGAIQAYFQALETGHFVEAVQQWETGTAQLNPDTLAEKFKPQFQAYRLTNVDGVRVDNDEATATATIEGQVTGGAEFTARPAVRLRRDPDGRGWRIVGMVFGPGDGVADPERLR